MCSNSLASWAKVPYDNYNLTVEKIKKVRAVLKIITNKQLEKFTIKIKTLNLSKRNIITLNNVLVTNTKQCYSCQS